MATLIKNIGYLATLDDQRRELKDAWIVIDGPQIAQVGTGALPKLDNLEETIDAKGGLVIPGMVNTHHHLYQTFFKNLPMVQDAKLFDWLVGLYEVWRELTPEDVRVSTLLGVGELLLTGCTTVADHLYLFPSSQTGELLDVSIAAAAQLGARFHPSRGSMSRGKSHGGLPPDDVVQKPEAILKDSERVIGRYHDPKRFSMCRLTLAPCSPFSVTDDLMKESARLARKHKVRLHTHLAETEDENDFCLKMVGLRPLDYMEKLDWLGPDVWYAHGVYLNESELKRMAATGTGIAHCPTSNLRLGSGIAPIPKALELGVPVGLAVDGSASNDASDMIGELRMCTMVHRVGSGVESMPARKALGIATRGGAQVLGRDDIGQIAPGFAADLAIFRLDDLGLAGAMHDPLAALCFTTGIRRADRVLVNGKTVVKDARLVNADAAEIFEKANRQSAAMVERAQKRTGLKFLETKQLS